MGARRLIFIAVVIVVGVLGLAGTVDQANPTSPAWAWLMGLGVAAVALVAFAVVARPTLQGAGSRPASRNPRQSRWAIVGVLGGVVLAGAVAGYAAIALCGAAVGGSLGLVIWTPTLGPRRAR